MLRHCPGRGALSLSNGVVTGCRMSSNGTLVFVPSARDGCFPMGSLLHLLIRPPPAQKVRYFNRPKTAPLDDFHVRTSVKPFGALLLKWDVFYDYWFGRTVISGGTGLKCVRLPRPGFPYTTFLSLSLEASFVVPGGVLRCAMMTDNGSEIYFSRAGKCDCTIPLPGMENMDAHTVCVWIIIYFYDPFQNKTRNKEQRIIIYDGTGGCI